MTRVQRERLSGRLQAQELERPRFNVTEHADTFTIDGNGRSANDPAYDLTNMTFGGTQQFTFDGWNRLVSVALASLLEANDCMHAKIMALQRLDVTSADQRKSVMHAGAWRHPVGCQKIESPLLSGPSGWR